MRGPLGGTPSGLGAEFSEGSSSNSSPGWASTRPYTPPRDRPAKGAHHRHYWPGWLVPRRAPTREGLRGPRAHPSNFLVHDRPDRSPVSGPARARDATVPPLRRPDRLVVIVHSSPRSEARRDLQP